jgi:SAM-dependent methyltransferase
VTAAERAALVERLDPLRTPAGHGPGSDGLLDLLPRSRAFGAASRRLYSAFPFDHRPPADEPLAFERALSPLARALGEVLPREGLVLDAGSGAGHTTLWLREKGVPIVALDQSVESLRRLRARADVPAVAADVVSLPFLDASFDAVVADGVVHHTTSPRAALSEVVRVLKPGGLLFLRVYRAEGRYPLVHRTVGGLLRACRRSGALDAVVWRCAFPAYRWAADRRARPAGEAVGRHDEGVFSDYFLTPRATPMRGGALHARLRRLGLEVLAYEAYRNVHGFLLRRRGAGAA